MITETKRTVSLVVNPTDEVKVVGFKNDVQKIQAYITSMVVDSPDKVKTITNDLASVMTLKNAIDEERKKYTQPLNTHKNFINSFFHTLTDPLDDITKSGKQKIKDYTMEQTRAREYEEVKARAAALAMAAAATPIEQIDSATGEITTAPAPLPIVNAPEDVQTKFRAELATSSQKMVAKCKVIDFNLLPDRFKMTNEKKLNNAVKDGERAISGVEIWEEPEISIRRRV